MSLLSVRSNLGRGNITQGWVLLPFVTGVLVWWFYHSVKVAGLNFSFWHWLGLRKRDLIV